MVIGGDDSPRVLEGLKKVPKIQIVPLEGNWKEEVVNKQVPVVVEIPKASSAISPTKRNKLFSFTTTKVISSLKRPRAKSRNSSMSIATAVIKDRLAARNLPVSVLKPFEIKPHNVAPPEKIRRCSLFGGSSPTSFVFLCLNGGMHPAMDLTRAKKSAAHGNDSFQSDLALASGPWQVPVGSHNRAYHCCTLRHFDGKRKRRANPICRAAPCSPA